MASSVRARPWNTSDIVDQILTISDSKVENITDIISALNNTKIAIKATTLLNDATKIINDKVIKSEEECKK